MSEPDEETVRRWREYTQASGDDHPASEPASPLRPAPTGRESSRNQLTSRRMAMLGLALFVVLAVIALAISRHPGGSPAGVSHTRGGEPASPGSGSGTPHNLVSFPDAINGTGTNVSGVSSEPGHLRNYMVDGRLDTSWRMLGAGTGREITFELDDTYRITELGLAVEVTGVRPLVKVTWSVKDRPSTWTQSLDATSTGVQRIKIPPVDTDAVTLTLDEVGAAPVPGADFTGISEVQIIGY